jgi:hypothetical protein
MQGILDCHCHGSDGFAVLQELLLLHHPRLLLSRAPQYDTAIQLRPTLQPSEYHTTYLQRFERWMDWMSMYHEFGVTHRPSTYSLWFIAGLSNPLQVQLTGQRQLLTRFQSLSRSATQDPPLLNDCHVGDLGLLLNVYAPETIRLTQRTAPLTVGTVASTERQIQDLEIMTNARLSEPIISPLNDEETADWVAAFGTAPGRDGPRGHRKFSQRTEPARPSVPCTHPPCRGQPHPPDLCCICNQPHVTSGCWHMTGLPAPMATRLEEFRDIAKRGDARPTTDHRVPRVPPQSQSAQRETRHGPPLRTGQHQINALETQWTPRICRHLADLPHLVNILALRVHY